MRRNIYKKGVRLVPRTYGGEQEKKIRPGTEPLPLIAAFGVACNEFAIEKNYEKVAELCEYAKNQLTKIDGVVINSPQNALPYVLNFRRARLEVKLCSISLRNTKFMFPRAVLVQRAHRVMC